MSDITTVRPSKSPRKPSADLKSPVWQHTRFPEAETPDDWSQGIPLAYTTEVVIDYWLQRATTCSVWRRRLNAYDNFLTEYRRAWTSTSCTSAPRNPGCQAAHPDPRLAR